ncbi:hypothetical protein EYF80_025980 [Liparis tanakae]|uniref:Uncharacterized protein n=1 Tax=Liparis tanakae TaxID=230148 RepID=A0A4Z2HD36_9TELE|nr:hypothetical protein EYF80_025980 [Liparis tanakae]
MHHGGGDGGGVMEGWRGYFELSNTSEMDDSSIDIRLSDFYRYESCSLPFRQYPSAWGARLCTAHMYAGGRNVLSSTEHVRRVQTVSNRHICQRRKQSRTSGSVCHPAVSQ